MQRARLLLNHGAKSVSDVIGCTNGTDQQDEQGRLRKIAVFWGGGGGNIDV
jgi:hypothetical protein